MCQASSDTADSRKSSRWNQRCQSLRGTWMILRYVIIRRQHFQIQGHFRGVAPSSRTGEPGTKWKLTLWKSTEGGLVATSGFASGASCRARYESSADISGLPWTAGPRFCDMCPRFHFWLLYALSRAEDITAQALRRGGCTSILGLFSKRSNMFSMSAAQSHQSPPAIIFSTMMRTFCQMWLEAHLSCIAGSAYKSVF